MGTIRDSIPQFTGNPEELNDFVDMILMDMTDEQLAYYSYSTFADTGLVTPSGYLLPPSAAGGYDGVGGVSTDLPMPIHIGQTWDIIIAKKYGQVKGDELRGTKRLSDPNTLIFTPTIDIRINPLWGRWYEGFSEDPYLIVEMSAAEGDGIVGDDNFYIKSQGAFKHFSSYGAEWERLTKTNYVSSRYLRESHFDSAIRILEKSQIVGIMTAFGAINGVPYCFTPYLRVLQGIQEYSLLSVSDYIADYNTLIGLGNGFDETYAKTPAQVAAMLIKARSFSNNDTNDKITINDSLEALNKGLFGITREDLEEQVRPQVELWVRTGYFNQDTYPYADLCADRNPVDANNSNNQAIALEAACSGMVLLKNESNILPLKDDSSILVTGILSDMHIKPWTSVSTPAGIENTGITALTALQNYMIGKTGNLTYDGNLSAPLFKVKSVSTGNYLTIDNDNYVVANTANSEEATAFQLYDWGQQGYSFIEPVSKKFLYYDFDGDSIYYTMVEISEDQAPSVFTWETDEEGHNLSRWGAVPSIPFHTVLAPFQFYEFYNSYGNYLSIDNSGKLVAGSEKGEDISVESYFEFEMVTSAGENIDNYVNDHDFAIVFVGSNSFVNASEVSDRKNIQMGEEQYTLVNKVAAAFPGKTVVVINSNLPLAIQDIQDNPNVAAILYTAYAGQYEAYALSQILFGEVTPSGKLTTSWLKDLTTLPELKDKDGIDDAYSVYMKNADAEQLNLTYRYNNTDDLIYEFGFGLSYTSFIYEDISVTAQEQSDDAIKVALTITNIGEYSGKEVIQVYMHAENSVYGEFVPKKQLAGFVKTNELKENESQTLMIEINPESLRRWDVTVQDYIVEEGTYTIMVGTSAENIIWSSEINILGDHIGQLDLTEYKNIWDSSYASIHATGIEVSKKRTSEFESNLNAVLSDKEEAYVILPNINFYGAASLEVSVAGINESNTIEIYSGGLNSDPICTFTFEATDSATYFLDADQTIPVEELSYITLYQELTRTIDSIEDLYIVFRQGGIRIDSIIAK